MTFVYLNSDSIGQGDKALGRKLLVAFLEQLAASEIKIDVIGCVNDGVKLTTEEGPALKALDFLLSRGARIATCGTCLDHLGLREQLKIGEVGQMNQTVQMLVNATKVISPC